MASELPTFIHDTRRIINANDAVGALFRCEGWELVDRDLLDFVPPEMRDLTKMNLYTTQYGHGTNLKPREYVFVRCDGSVFSCVVTSKALGGGQFETVVRYKGEAS